MLDLTTARRLAKEIVTERGRDFVYNPESGACLYVRSDDPRLEDRLLTRDGMRALAKGAAVTACLVGEILARAGLMTDEIARSTTRIGALARWEPQPLSIEFAAVAYLAALQRHQDAGKSWGVALDAAEASLTLQATLTDVPS